MKNFLTNTRALAVAAVDELTLQLTRAQGWLERLAERIDPGEDGVLSDRWQDIGYLSEEQTQRFAAGSVFVAPLNTPVPTPDDVALAASLIATAKREPWPLIPVSVSTDGGETFTEIGDYWDVQPVGFEVSEDRVGLTWRPDGFAPAPPIGGKLKLSMKVDTSRMSPAQLQEFYVMTGIGA